VKKENNELPVVDFPKQFWFYRPALWGLWRKFSRPITLGSDEFGRHVFHIGIPGLVGIAIPYKWCGPGCPDYDDDNIAFKDWRCSFPGCPAFCMGGRTDETHWCLVHDERFWRGWIDERRKEIAEGN
jgi:hypothetical protein